MIYRVKSSILSQIIDLIVSIVIGVVICVDVYIFLVGFKFPCTITTDFGKYFYTILGANLGND